jgi:benzoyl-CoA 2,3-dioxygenase component B
MFTYFTDRDGKFQLALWRESGFDPLARTCRFMLTEEAHHMFVGETGVGRTIQRTYSLSLDLFGSEVSTNAANFYNAGLKGRFQETKIDDDHRLTNATYPVMKMVNGQITLVDEPALTALNMRLRDDYVADCAKGVERWNKIIEKTGVKFRLELPHVAFHRHIGEFKDIHATPKGILVDDATWARTRDEYLPSSADGDFITSLMQPVSEPGKFASWIAAPKVGIDNKPGDFEYVKIAA